MSQRKKKPVVTELKTLANERDVPYQSLLEVFLAERVVPYSVNRRRFMKAVGQGGG